MNPLFRNLLAVLAGIIFGSIVNMGIISISGSVIPPPNGADLSTMEGLKANMHLLQPIHFLPFFLAHAVGTFAGAWITAKIAVNHKIKLALIIGAFFLLGGIITVFSLPSPVWYTIIDLAFAYIPMSYMAGKLALKKS